MSDSRMTWGNVVKRNEDFYEFVPMDSMLLKKCVKCGEETYWQTVQVIPSTYEENGCAQFSDSQSVVLFVKHCTCCTPQEAREIALDKLRAEFEEHPAVMGADFAFTQGKLPDE